MKEVKLEEYLIKTIGIMAKNEMVNELGTEDPPDPGLETVRADVYDGKDEGITSILCKVGIDTTG